MRKLPRLIQRLRLLFDLARLSWLVKNPYKAYGYLRRGWSPDQISFRFHDMQVAARKQDWSAVREVLLDDEYACLDELFAPTERPRILDLGANIGCFALRSFGLLPNASVVSVEAADDTVVVLKHNKERNPDLLWQVIHGAVWSTDGPLTLERTNNSTGHQVSNNDSGEQVDGFSLKTILSRIGWEHVHLIKMDIEGAEAEVVPASEEVFRCSDCLIIEIHNDRIDGEMIFNILKDIYPCIRRINRMQSNKPLYLMSKKSI